MLPFGPFFLLFHRYHFFGQCFSISCLYTRILEIKHSVSFGTYTLYNSTPIWRGVSKAEDHTENSASVPGEGMVSSHPAQGGHCAQACTR